MRFLFYNPFKYGILDKPPLGGGDGGTPPTEPPTEPEENLDINKTIDEAIGKAVEPVLKRFLAAFEEKAKTIGYVSPSQEEKDLESKGGYADIGAFTQDVVRLTHGMKMDPEKKALMETRVGDDGGILVPTEFSSRLFGAAKEQSVLWNRITMLPINGNNIELPSISDYSHSGGSYFGGVQNYWIEEDSTATQTQPRFNMIQLRLHDNMTVIPVTSNLLNDSPITVAPLVELLASNALSLAMDNVFLRGDGVGKPKGILNANAKIEISKETGQDKETLVYKNIIKMFARFNMRYLRNATWLGNQTILTELPGLNIVSGTSGSLIYMPPGGLSAAPMGTILGVPLGYTEFCSTLGTVGDLVLCDPTQYLGIDKAKETAWSKEIYFLYDRQVLRMKYRVDGQMWQNSVFTPANGDTLAPIVTLASRA